MTKNLIWIGCLLGVGLVTGLLADDKNQSNQNAQKQDNPSAGQTAQPSNRQAADQDAIRNLSPDQRFLTELYKGNLFEIAFAQLVIDKTRGSGQPTAGAPINNGPNSSGTASNTPAPGAPGAKAADDANSAARITGTPTSRNPANDTTGHGAQGGVNARELAQMLVADHTKANEQVMQLAQGKNFQIDKKMEDWQQAKLQHLSRLPANELANCFVFDQVGHHQTDVLKLRYQATNAQESDVKQLVNQLLPVMQKHLDHASQAAAQLVGGNINLGDHGREGSRQG